MKIQNLKVNLLGILVILVAAYAGNTLLAQDSTTTATQQVVNQLEPAKEGGEGLRFNFRGVPLDTVLKYLSEAAGFIIIRNTDISGRVDVISHQPLNKEEAVNLLNTVLNEKGYAAIQNGRILTIVTREEAGKRNIPVIKGREPESIPKTDEMVTQIIPVRYANVVKLMENIKQLLPNYAIITANESSNAIVLTDTQADIRRMAEIIEALDTSISEISNIKVFLLRYADATDTAKLITSLYDTSQSNQARSDPRATFFARRFGGGEQNTPSDNANSEALQASSRVLAVADQHTNSVVVSAPAEVIPVIDTLIKEIDVLTQELTQVRVFTLKYAKASDMADLLKTVFDVQTTTNQTTRSRRFFDRNGPPMPAQQQEQSQRSQEESKVLVKADERTNSVVVSAVKDTMVQIASVVESLDKNPAKNQNIFVYSLKNADTQEVANILKQMFSGQTSSGTSTNTNTTRRTNTTNTTGNRNNTNTSNQRSSQTSR